MRLALSLGALGRHGRAFLRVVLSEQYELGLGRPGCAGL